MKARHRQKVDADMSKSNLQFLTDWQRNRAGRLCPDCGSFTTKLRVKLSKNSVLEVESVRKVFVVQFYPENRVWVVNGEDFIVNTTLSR